MHKLARVTLTAALLVTVPAVTGCGGDKGGDKKEEEVEVIPQAANGSPVAIKHVEFIGEGEGRGMKIKLYNHGDKTAAGMTLLFRYYDGDDKLLKVKEGTPFEKDSDFTSVSGGRYKVEPKKNAKFEIEGMMVAVPAAATRVEVITSKVDAIAADGNTIEDWWSQENWADWPE